MSVSLMSLLVLTLSVIDCTAHPSRNHKKQPQQVLKRRNPTDELTRIATDTHTTVQHIGTYTSANYTSYLYMSVAAASWLLATKDCAAILGESAHLLYIESEVEFQYLSRVMLKTNLTDELFWIGGRFNMFHNYFEWADGTPFYERIHWDYGYPDSKDIHTRILLWYDADLKFRTARETKSALYICELDLLNEHK